MLPLYPLNNVTQFHEWRGRIPALTDGVLAAIFRIKGDRETAERASLARRGKDLNDGSRFSEDSLDL